LAKADLSDTNSSERLQKKVVAITSGTHTLGALFCEKAALMGATVYSIDTDAEALARQVISFRQNKLRLRAVHCDTSAAESMENAIQEIVSHAPPIDLWIHAEKLTHQNYKDLQPTLSAFENHFSLRGKGSISLLIAPTFSIKENIEFKNKVGQLSTKQIAINLISIPKQFPAENVSRILNIDLNLSGVYTYIV